MQVVRPQSHNNFYPQREILVFKIKVFSPPPPPLKYQMDRPLNVTLIFQN